MTELYYLKIPSDLEESIFTRFCGGISEERRIRILKLLRYEDKVRSLFAELLLLYALERYGEPWRDPKDLFGALIVKNSYGKPYFREPNMPYFNLSHSGDYVLCGISNDEIGVDIEKRKALEPELARRFFSDEEYRFLSSRESSLQTECFYDLWTFKESYVKAEGKGLSIPFDSFTISVQGRFAEVCVKEGKLTGVHLISLKEIDHCYSGAVCLKGQKEELEKMKIYKVCMKEIVALL